MNIPFLSKLRSGARARASENPYGGWPAGSIAFVSKLCIGPDRKKVRFMRRDQPRSAQDSGWTLFSREERMRLNPADFVATALPAFIRDDPPLEKPFQTPVSTEWTRKPPEDVWLRIVGGDVVGDQGQVVGHAR
jgi:hypothetical protein